jgi:hypothetical protein
MRPCLQQYLERHDLYLEQYHTKEMVYLHF